MKIGLHTTTGILAATALASLGTIASAFGLPNHEQTIQPAVEQQYIFTYLVLDEPDKLSEDEMNTAMAGHFENMGRMAEAGDLLIAGPLADPRIDQTYRGIFVFSSGDIEQGKALFNSDPGVQAGVFKPEMYVITCDEPLQDLTRLEKEYEQRRLDDPEIPDEWVGRMFILAVADADTAFEKTDDVLIDAAMDRIDDNTDEPRHLLWLDATNPEEAKAKLKTDDLDAWSFYGWYGSPCVAELGC